MKKRKSLILIGLLFVASLYAVHAATVQDSSATDFNQGTHSRTFYNSTAGAVQLNRTAGMSGTFTSRVFDASSDVAWDNITWWQAEPYGTALPDNAAVESGWESGNVNMSGNKLLLHLDEISGTLYDTSGNGNNGTNNGATYGATGVFGNAMSFDGTNDYINVPHSSSLLLNDNYSIEFWFNPASDVTQWRRFLEKSNQFYMQFIGGDKIRVQINGYATLDSGSTIQRANWTHVVVTVHNTPNGNDLLRIYVNGNLDNMVGPTWGTPLGGTNPITIGGGSGEYTKSSFDEVAVYDRVLTATEIADHYKRGALHMNLSARSCDDSACSGESFTDLELSSPQTLSLDGARYFQYRFGLATSSSSFVPLFSNVSVGYSILNSAPNINLVHPAEGSVFTSSSSVSVNFSISDADGNQDACWYVLDGGAAVNLAGCSNTTLNVADGNHDLTIFVNDTYGVVANDSASFRVDVTRPSVTIHMPQNSTYNTTSIFLNYSVSDSVGIGTCWYKLDSFASVPLNGCSTTSLSVGQGSHIVTVYANDTSGNVGSSNVTFSVDSVAPQWSTLASYVPSMYSTSLSFFNVTWIDSGGIRSVWFESNFSGQPQNYTMNPLGGGVYGFNASIPAGSFYWRSWANDSSGNRNVTTTQIVTVARAGNAISLWIDGNLNQNVTVTYGNITNATATAEHGLVTLERDGVAVTNPEISILAANVAGYEYSATVEGNQNYSSNSTIYYLFVEKESGAVALYLNGAESDVIVGYGEMVNATASSSARLYLDGVEVSSPSIRALSAGYHNYTAVIEESENVTGSTLTRFVNVTRAAPTLQMLLNSLPSDVSSEYGAATNATAYESNNGDGDLVYSFYIDGAALGSGSYVSDYLVLGVGIYNYSYSTSGGENYTSGSISRSLTVTQATPSITILADGAESDLEKVYGSETNVTASIDYGLELTLYRNGIEVGSGSSVEDLIALNADYYNYTAAFGGNENYSAVSGERFVNITKATPTMALTLNGNAFDIPVSAGELVEVNASISEPSGAEIYLYENDVLNASGNSLSVRANYTSLGTRTWRAEYAGNQNYSARNLSYRVDPIDTNAPTPTNPRYSFSSGSSYVSGRNYQFNLTWTDNTAIDEVIFTFNGVNYSHASGQIAHNGNEYHLTLQDLPAGSHSFRWFANDSAGNSTTWPSSLGTYEIVKASASLLIGVQPSENFVYGTTSTITCVGDNEESQPVLKRGALTVSNPEETILGAGTHFYFCSSAATQNYSAASAPSTTLTVSKGTPVLNLTLNNVAGDLTLPSGGGLVNISADLVSPSSGPVNVSVGGVLIYSGNDPSFNETQFSSEGSHEVIAYFGGDMNYTAGSTTRNVIVSSPPQQQIGGGGGGGRDDDDEVIITPTIESSGIGVSLLDTFILKRGTDGSGRLQVVNTGREFLNDCHVEFKGNVESWFRSSGSQGLSPGERFAFSIDVAVPEEIEPGEYLSVAEIRCSEKSATYPVKILVYRNAFEMEVLDYERRGSDLAVRYSLEEQAGADHSLQISYELRDFDDVIRYQNSFNAYLRAQESREDELTFALPKDSFGEFRLVFRLSDGLSETVAEEEIFLPSQGGGLAGFAVSGENRRSMTVGAIVLVVFVLMYAGMKLVFHIKRKRTKAAVFRSRHFRVHHHHSAHHVHHAHH